jgi:hypothetical protein
MMFIVSIACIDSLKSLDILSFMVFWGSNNVANCFDNSHSFVYSTLLRVMFILTTFSDMHAHLCPINSHKLVELPLGIIKA